MEYLVYLAGPITGLTYAEATNWRDRVREQLPEHIKMASPLRMKHFLRDAGELGGANRHTYADHPLATDRGLTARDRHDVYRAHAILMNLLSAKQITIGTMIELGWADARQIPVVIVMESENVHHHPMVRAIASFIVPTLEQGVDTIKAILSHE